VIPVKPEDVPEGMGALGGMGEAFGMSEMGSMASDSTDKVENVIVRGRVVRQDVKKIVELAEQIPGITQRIASLKLMKDGEVWGTTVRRFGESSLIVVKRTGDEWKVADTITIRGQLTDEDVQAVILLAKQDQRQLQNPEGVDSVELRENGEVWCMLDVRYGNGCLIVVKRSGDDWELASTIPVFGQLLYEEVKSVFPFVRHRPSLLNLEVIKKGEVHVMVGQPMAGGNVLVMKKADGKWKVESVDRWVE
jgi:hypothetical protein